MTTGNDLGEAPRPIPTATWLVGVVGLLVLTLGLYAQTIRFDFVNLDDGRFVTDNPVVLRGVTAAGIRYAFTDLSTSNWCPLTNLSFLLDADLWAGDRPGQVDAGPMHVENAILHAGSAVLLLAWLAVAAGKFWPAWFVAALFAVHPTHVESVAWIAERRDTLSTFFLMGTLLAYVLYARSPTAGGYWTAVRLFALSLLYKGMGVTLPGLLVLINVWPLRRETPVGKIAVELVPFVVLAGGALLIGVAAQAANGAIDSYLPLTHRLAHVCVAYLTYAGMLVAPVRLSVYYPTYAAMHLGTAAAAAAGVLAVTAGAVVYRRKFPEVFVGWFWFLGTLVPVIGLVQLGSQSVADRYTYLSSIGLFVAVVYPLARRFPAAVTVPPAAIATAALAVLAYLQIGYWHDSGSLFRRSVETSPDSWLAYLKLGDYYAKQRDLVAAESSFRQVLRVSPENPVANFNVGICVFGRDPAGSVEYFRRAVANRPRSAQYHTGLARALAATGEVDAAATEANAALAIDPSFAPALAVQQSLPGQ